MSKRTDDGLDPRLASLLEHADWARRLAGRLVADAARADDVAQSALLAAASSPPRETTNLRGWLSEVVRNAARGIGREESRRSRREVEAARAEAIEGADELAARAEMSTDLARHVLALDAVYRDVVLLRWYEGLPPRDIARKLGVPVATVSSRLARAHAELRTLLDRAYGDRATWCAAFGPHVLAPKMVMSVGALVAVFVLFAAAIGAVAVVRSRPEPARDVEVARGVGAMFEPESRSERTPSLASASASNGRTPAVVIDPTATTALSRGTTELASVKTTVRGRLLDMRGDPLAGLRVTAVDPTLPSWDGETLRVGELHVAVRRTLWDEIRADPAMLDSFLAHMERPVGLRELLLGIDRSSSGVTSSDGTFALDVLGTSPRCELADDRWIVVSRGDVPDHAEPIWLVAPSVRIAGRVVDRRGASVPDARLHTSGEDASLAKLPFEFDGVYLHTEDWKTGADGMFDLGRVARIEGGRIQIFVDGEFVGDAEVPATDVLDLVLVARDRAPRLHVRGVVLDANGAGVEGADVRMEGNFTRSDASGRFDLEALHFSDNSDLVAIRRGQAPGWIEGLGKELREKRGLAEVVLRIGPALAITGRAVDANGAALTGWLVSLEDAIPYPQMGVPVEFIANGVFGEGSWPRTHDDGRFTIGGLASRTYRLRFADTATGLVHLTDSIAAGTSDFEVRLGPDPWHERVRGRVLSSSGSPVADVQVSVLYPKTAGRNFSTSGHAQSDTTDEQGRFELERVPRRGAAIGLHGKEIDGARTTLAEHVDPNDVVLTVMVLRSFQVEVDADLGATGLEILDARGVPLVIEAHSEGVSSDTRARLEGGSFPPCKVAEDGVTIVLYRGDQEVRRAPITWTGERLQKLRP